MAGLLCNNVLSQRLRQSGLLTFNQVAFFQPLIMAHPKPLENKPAVLFAVGFDLQLLTLCEGKSVRSHQHVFLPI